MGQRKIEYYGQPICIKTNFKGSFVRKNLRPKEKKIQILIDKLNEQNWENLVQELINFKKDYELNDWFYFVFLNNAIDQILTKYDDNLKTFYVGYILYKSGYKIKLKIGKKIQIYGYSKDDLYGTLKLGDFYNLTYLFKTESQHLTGKAIFSDVLFNKNGIGFDFSHIVIPRLTENNYFKKKITFRLDDKFFNFEIMINKTTIDLIKTYPVVDIKNYFFVSLSDSCYSSLIPLLKNELKGLSTYESVRFLLSFVGTSYKHKDDLDIYQRDKPMIPEEALYYEFSDCEDRSALFSYLVKEILDLPILIFEYPNHVNVGVAIKPAIGRVIEYKDLKYVMCEPSGPMQKAILGESPQAKGLEPKIIGEYFPESYFHLIEDTINQK